MFSNNFFAQFLGLTLLSLLGTISPVLADYNPPDAEVPDGSTVANGSRTSCKLEAKNITFTPLLPMTHLAKGDRQPELFFYVPVTSPYRIDVGILDEDGEFLDFIEIADNKPGIVAVPMSLELEMGGRYQLYSGLACGSDSQYHTESTAYFELEPAPVAMRTKLTEATDSDTQSEIYADAGYWVDAFALANETQRLDLLEQLATFETEAQQANLEVIAKILTLKQTEETATQLAP